MPIYFNFCVNDAVAKKGVRCKSFFQKITPMSEFACEECVIKTLLKTALKFLFTSLRCEFILQVFTKCRTEA